MDLLPIRGRVSKAGRQNIQMVEIEGKMMPKQQLGCVSDDFFEHFYRVTEGVVC
jgi:hypothetical protein